mmetsp:Transcript_107313/g.256241  ORF Transcript_107313/g.256241 Transcript_107313/m.256241 type:complete len:207 (-) Transcript_107313:1013-1633(-)
MCAPSELQLLRFRFLDVAMFAAGDLCRPGAAGHRSVRGRALLAGSERRRDRGGAKGSHIELSGRHGQVRDRKEHRSGGGGHCRALGLECGQWLPGGHLLRQHRTGLHGDLDADQQPHGVPKRRCPRNAADQVRFGLASSKHGGTQHFSRGEGRDAGGPRGRRAWRDLRRGCGAFLAGEPRSGAALDQCRGEVLLRSVHRGERKAGG